MKGLSWTRYHLCVNSDRFSNINIAAYLVVLSQRNLVTINIDESIPFSVSYCFMKFPHHKWFGQVHVREALQRISAKGVARNTPTDLVLA